MDLWSGMEVEVVLSNGLFLTNYLFINLFIYCMQNKKQNIFLHMQCSK